MGTNQLQVEFVAWWMDRLSIVMEEASSNPVTVPFLRFFSILYFY